MPRPSLERRRLVVRTLACFLAILTSSLEHAAAQDDVPLAPPPTSVRVATVRLDDVQDRRRFIGSLMAISRSAVAAREDGAIERVLVEEGDLVAAGAPLAELDARRLDAELAGARADLAVARATIDERDAERTFALRDLENGRNAYAEGAANDREIMALETNLQVANARLESAGRAIVRVEERIKLLEIRRADAVVRAPFAARVVARHAEPGEWVVAGDPVVTLVSTGAIEAWLTVPERLAPAISATPGTIFVETAGESATRPSQRVRAIGDVDPRARTFRLVVTLADADGRLAPGMSAAAWVPTGERAIRLTVPRDAVVQDARGSTVTVARSLPDGSTIAEPVPVRVLFIEGDRFAIDGAGLADGDAVVVEGNERLFPGTPLAPIATD